MTSIGTDGASNMCGMHNSFYTHLKKQIPNLMIFKCVCHSIDKCAEHAFKFIPDPVSDLMNDTANWLNSAKRWDEYVQYYKVRAISVPEYLRLISHFCPQTIQGGKSPHRLISLSKTRWLVWAPSSDILLDQWYELRGFFAMKGAGPKVRKCNIIKIKN